MRHCNIEKIRTFYHRLASIYNQDDALHQVARKDLQRMLEGLHNLLQAVPTLDVFEESLARKGKADSRPIRLRQYSI